MSLNYTATEPNSLFLEMVHSYFFVSTIFRSNIFQTNAKESNAIKFALEKYAFYS